MSTQVALSHITRYRYDRAVALGPQVVRLRPAPHCRTRILSYSLCVEPVQHSVHWQQDPFANHLARLIFPAKTDELRISVDLVAAIAACNPFDFFLEPSAERHPFVYESGLRRDLLPYLVCAEATPRFREFVAGAGEQGQRTIDFVVALNRLVQREIKYSIRLEPGVQTPEQTLESASGSCRDSGWLLVQALRHFGCAARFVSGYLIQLRQDGAPPAQSDFTDLHAWCEVYLPGAGWIGLDPTSGLLTGEGHIPLAATPEPSSAAPVSGLVEECRAELWHAMSVTRSY